MGLTGLPRTQSSSNVAFISLILVVLLVLGVLLLPTSPSSITLRQAHDEVVQFPNIPLSALLQHQANFRIPETPLEDHIQDDPSPDSENDPAPDNPAPDSAPIGYVIGPPSITANQIQAVLDQYNSPAKHIPAQVWIDLGREYGIDPAYALAFFIHESSAGTNPRWDGMIELNHDDVSRSVTTHNIGNISCAGYKRCTGRWRHYNSWEEGIRDWYRLINNEYVLWRGADTVEKIIPIYAPAHENNVQNYIDTVHTLVTTWRGEQQQQTACHPGTLAPCGNPLGNRTDIVMTQGYGVGSHSPTTVWGAIDLAIDGNGDGYADPDASWYQPVYATHNGIVTTTPDSYPGGNHVWVANNDYRTGYAHLHEIHVTSGEDVQRGQIIGTMGSTGKSSGPHLDYQVWQKNQDQWVNVNPLGF